MSHPSSSLDISPAVHQLEDYLKSIGRYILQINRARRDDGVLWSGWRAAMRAQGVAAFLRNPEITRRLVDVTERLRAMVEQEGSRGTTVLRELARELGALARLTREQLCARKHESSKRRRPREQDLETAETMLQPHGDGAPSPRRLSPLQAAPVLVRCVRRTLKAYGIDVMNVGMVREEVCDCRAADWLVNIDVQDTPGIGFIFAFPDCAASAIARAVSHTVAGALLETADDEEEELVRDSLSEFANHAINGLLRTMRQPGSPTAPVVLRHREAPEQPLYFGSRSFRVNTAAGHFEACALPRHGIFAGLQYDSDAEEQKVVRALVADDSLVMRRSIARILEQAGLQVVAQAKDGLEAVELFRRHRPDVVTLDLTMPRMGGLDALQIIQAEDANARVLICSAVGDKDVMRQGLQHGAVGYLIKPFTPDRLLGAVDVLLKRSAARQTPQRRSRQTRLLASKLGAYRIRDLLGEGGMGAIYRAWDTGLDREVAVKILGDRYSADADVVVRFLREARALAQVRHPNVVDVYYAGSDEGKHFFAMELLPGPDLQTLVRQRGPLPPADALNYVRQAAAGLAAAQDNGLIHCDVKPANLILGTDGKLRLTDFGLAQLAADRKEGPLNEIAGTPAFMAPEQFLIKTMDHRTDIYGLGGTLFYVLTGRSPYKGKDCISLALQHLEKPVPDLPKAAASLQPLLGRMMAKDMSRRPATYAELLERMDGLTKE
jgi:CheY-like chemotaxis protein